MDIKNDFSDLYKASVKSALKKALFYSLFISFSTLFVVSLSFWIFNVKQYWIAFIAFGVIFALLSVLLFLKFKPDEKDFYRELDSLGLKQRAITMYEYQNDDSLMATIQRQNAIEHISKVDKGLIKFAIPTLLLVLAISAIILGVGSTTVSALSANGIIKNGRDTIKQVIPQVVPEYDVKYIAKKNGTIEGAKEQVVKEGEDATYVIAIPDDGYVFISWSDGNKDPYRHDTNVTKNIEVYATFVTVDEYLELTKDPGAPVVPRELGNSSDSGDGSGGDSQGDGKNEARNQIIDGKTYYGDETFDQYLEQALDSMSQDADLSDESKSLVDDYFDTIEK